MRFNSVKNREYYNYVKRFCDF